MDIFKETKGVSEENESERENISSTIKFSPATQKEKKG